MLEENSKWRTKQHAKFMANKMDEEESQKRGSTSKENNGTERNKESGQKIQEARAAMRVGGAYNQWQEENEQTTEKRRITFYRADESTARTKRRGRKDADRSKKKRKMRQIVDEHTKCKNVNM